MDRPLIYSMIVHQDQHVILVVRVNFVLDPTIKPLFAMIAPKGITKVKDRKRHVYRAFPVNIQT